MSTKLIVQIPCLNEEHTLPATLADLPRHIEGIDRIEVLVVDDGSSDATVAVARAHGVDHIIVNRRNMGLASSFRLGLDHCLRLGADIIVNTDGDNQYCGGDIARLVQPILEGRADVVIGDRQTATVSHFSPAKRLLQHLGSAVVRAFSGVDVPDAVSGFRAISRDAAFRINIVSRFSYTIEMLIQVGRKGIAYASVPVGVNPGTRESRLFKSIGEFIQRSGATLLRMYAMYQPLRIFVFTGLVLTFLGLIPIVRFLWAAMFTDGHGKVQSLVLGVALLVIGSLNFALGLLADLLANNRMLLEFTLEKVRRIEDQLMRDAAGRGADAGSVSPETDRA